MTRTFTSLLLLLSAAPAAADPAADARARFNEGRDRFRHRDYSGARAAFEDANRILPNPRVYANIAACYEGEENAVGAVRTYRRFLYEGADAIAADARANAERSIARLRPSVGDLVFAVEPVGAEIRVDGEVLGAAPLPWPVAVAPGPRLVEVRAYGHAPYSTTIDAAAGSDANVRVVLERVTSEAARPAASTAPAAAASPAEGSSPEPRRGPDAGAQPLGRGPLLWIGAGLTAALAVGGAVTGVLALSAESDANDETRPVADRRSDADRANSLATITDVLVDAALVAGISTFALYVFAGPDEEEPMRTALVVPSPTPGGLRCDLALTF